jgi:hypothetical protein
VLGDAVVDAVAISAAIRILKACIIGRVAEVFATAWSVAKARARRTRGTVPTGSTVCIDAAISTSYALVCICTRRILTALARLVVGAFGVTEARVVRTRRQAGEPPIRQATTVGARHAIGIAQAHVLNISATGALRP